MFRLFVCMAFALALIGCGSRQLLAAPSDTGTGNSISAPAASPLTVQVKAAYSSRWQIDGDSNPANWSRAVDGDCGSLTFPTDTSVVFQFTSGKSPGSCERDQLNPLVNGSLIRLTPGQTYTWRMKITPNYPARVPNLSSIFWQVHQYNAGSNGCTITPQIGFDLDDHGSGSYVWAAWEVHQAGKSVPAVMGREVDVKIVVKISQGRDGIYNVWINGAQLAAYRGPTVAPPPCNASPFTNFGPYVTHWVHNNQKPPITVGAKFEEYVLNLKAPNK